MLADKSKRTGRRKNKISGIKRCFCFPNDIWSAAEQYRDQIVAEKGIEVHVNSVIYGWLREKANEKGMMQERS
jgi:hypothetical protein